MGIIEDRKKKAEEKALIKEHQIKEAVKLKNQGYTNIAAAKKMGISESSFRKLVK